jgi:hypothetical protein
MAVPLDQVIFQQLHLKWPSFDNIHRHLVKANPASLGNVIVLEKMDGSNLGIELSGGELTALHGRNNLIWHRDCPESSLSQRYGSVTASTLEPVNDYVDGLTKLAELVGQPNLVVYGEWFQSKRDDSVGWFPFGYGVRSLDGDKNCDRFQTMTPSLYHQLITCGLTPPPVLFRDGPIHQAVELLEERMLRPEHPDSFEGVFITLHDTDLLPRACLQGYKWKTGWFEEQPRWVPNDHLITGEWLATLERLKQVFTNQDCQSGSKQRQPATAAQLEKIRQQEEWQQQHRQVKLAFDSVMSKSPIPLESIRATTGKARGEAIRKLITDVTAEAESQYRTSETPIPDGLVNTVSKMVPRLVFQG